MNCTFCCMPRESSSIFASPQSLSAVLSAKRSIHSSMRRSASFAAEPLELGEEAKDAAHLHLLVESALLGEIADAVEDRLVGVGACRTA